MSPFREVLHIFLKDVRYLRLVIAAWLGYLLVVVARYPRTWTNSMGGDRDTTLLLAGIPVFCWLLVNMVIHQEPLTSDRSFWLTRPYRRASLLLSKVLFVLVFVLLPVGGMQLALIHQAGIPTSHLLGLVTLNVLALSFFPVLFAAGAVVVPKLVWALLVVLGMALFVGGIAGLGSWLITGLDPAFGHELAIFLVLTSAIAAILIQYFSRRTQFARGVLIGCAVIIAVPAVLPLSRISVPLLYPAFRPDAAGAIKVRFDDTPDRRNFDGVPPADGADVAVYLPIAAEGPGPTHSFLVDGLRLRLRAKNGTLYDSGWEKRGDEVLVPGYTAGTLTFKVPRWFYNAAGREPVALTADYAVHHTELQVPHTYILQRGNNFIPDLGLCELQSAPYGKDSLQCRRAFFPPLRADVTAYWTEGECNDPNAMPNKFGQATVAGDYEQQVLPLSLPGVTVDSTLLEGGARQSNAGHTLYHLCPGSRIVVQRIRSTGKNLLSLQTRFTLQDFSGDPVEVHQPAPPPSNNDGLE